MVIRAGVTDLGAGQAASLANIAGEILGITVDRTSRAHRRQRTDPADRRHVRHPAAVHVRQRGAEGGAGAAREARAGGRRAARMRRRPICGSPANRVLGRGTGRSRMGELSRAAEHQSVMPYHHDTFDAETGKFDAETGRGRSFPDCTHGAHAVEVEVDTATGEVRILKYVAVHDIGRAINMQRVEGQIQGAVAQGVGYALSEEVEVSGGVVHVDAVRRLPHPHRGRSARHQGDRPRAAPGQGAVRGPRDRRATDRTAARGAGQRDPRRGRGADAPAADDPRAHPGRAARGPRAIGRPHHDGRTSVARRDGPRWPCWRRARAEPPPIAPILGVRAAGVPRVDDGLPADAAARRAPRRAAARASPRCWSRTSPSGWACRRSRCSAPRGRFTVRWSSTSARRSRRSRRSTGAAATAARRPPAHAGRRHRRQPRPGGGAHGGAARTGGEHLRARRHGAGADRGASRARAPTVTVVDGGYDDAVARVGAGRRRALPGHLRHLVAGLRARAGLGDRGLQHDLRRDRRGARTGRARATGRGGGPDRRRRAGGGGGAPLLVARRASAPRLVGVEPTSAACVLESVAAGADRHARAPADLDHGRAELRHARR